MMMIYQGVDSKCLGKPTRKSAYPTVSKSEEPFLPEACSRGGTRAGGTYWDQRGSCMKKMPDESCGVL